MKLLTLNTHRLEETDYESKLLAFAGGIWKEQPDIIALQEVNQTQTSSPVDLQTLKQCGYVPCMPCENGIRQDNHGFRLACMFASRGIPYQWTWCGAKTGYGKYDEGLAVFSRFPVSDTHQFYITGIHDYSNWKTRKILGISLDLPWGREYFYSVHMGWWDDGEEPFQDQWARISQNLPRSAGSRTWLMGDFNSPSHIKGEGRDLLLRSGWHDSYDMADDKDSGITVSHAIDGWKERGDIPGMRIDYIWTDRPLRVRTSRTIFNGTFYPVVSDHFGTMIEY